jgi:hypothetical protein
MVRAIAVWALVVLGGIFAILALVAGYIRFQALDTNSVEQMANELIADPEIRDQVAATLVDEFYANVDVQAAIQQRLPADQQGLAGVIAGATRIGADRAAPALLERPRVQELWVRTITATHRNLLRILEDETGPVSAESGNLVLDLRPLVIQLGDRVAIVGRVDQRLLANPDAGRITIMKADNLETAQDLTQILKVLGLWLWLVPILLWAIALWLARSARRPILRGIAISSMVAGLIVLVIIRASGSAVVDDLTSVESQQKAAHDAWDIITAPLRDGGLTLVGLGVILLVAVWIAGPGRRATQTRRWLAPYLARPEFAFGGAYALLFLLVLWGPTLQTRRWQLILASAIVLAIGVEVLRRQTAKEFPDLQPKGALNGDDG